MLHRHRHTKVDVAQLVDCWPGEGLEFLGPESAATMIAMATHQCLDFSNVIICAPIRCAFGTLRFADSDPVSGERERERETRVVVSASQILQGPILQLYQISPHPNPPTYKSVAAPVFWTWHISHICLNGSAG